MVAEISGVVVVVGEDSEGVVVVEEAFIQTLGTEWDVSLVFRVESSATIV